MKGKLKQYARILRVAKKPNKLEYKNLLKVAGLGLLIIGFIGFIIEIGARLLI